MSDVILTPEDIVWYLTIRDLGPVAQDCLMQALYAGRSRYLAPIYQTGLSTVSRTDFIRYGIS